MIEDSNSMANHSRLIPVNHSWQWNILPYIFVCVNNYLTMRTHFFYTKLLDSAWSTIQVGRLSIACQQMHPVDSKRQHYENNGKVDVSTYGNRVWGTSARDDSILSLLRFDPVRCCRGRCCFRSSHTLSCRWASTCAGTSVTIITGSWMPNISYSKIGGRTSIPL